MDDNRIVDLYWQRKEKAISETALKYGKYLNCISYKVLMNQGNEKEIEIPFLSFTEESITRWDC